MTNLIRCRTCVMPNTRPDSAFLAGVCPACHTYTNRPNIDWDTRRHDLIQLLEEHDGYCVVPSSGGKDSHAQVKILQDLGAKVTCITATTCHLTPIGRANLDNLARYATTIEISPNKAQRARLNRKGLELVGDISWPEHVAIFTQPFKMAGALGHSLMFYGENPQAEYGGPPGSEKAREMTRRWVSEFGGYLGLRTSDIEGEDMLDYELPNVDHRIWEVVPEAHFLGAYVPWDSRKNARIANEMGMRQIVVSKANWWLSENQDNAQTGLHDHMMYRKYGFGRGCQQISVDVRAGRMSRENALEWVRIHDGLYPAVYAGVRIEDIIMPLDLSLRELHTIMDQFTNHDLFKGEVDGRPILKEFA
jgi:hypothetical protein